MNIFNVGEEFINWEVLLARKREYESACRALLVVDDSHKLKGVSDFVTVMVYDRLILKCKAGTERPSQSKGLRETATYKKNCPVEIKIVLRDDKLVVKSSHLQHENHPTDAQTFAHYPENLRLNEEQIKLARSAMEVDGNKKKLKRILTEKREGKPVKLKALHNIQTKMRLEKEQLHGDECELQKLLDTMLQNPNATVRVLRNENGDLLAVYYQDTRMSQLFETYPEVLLFDATYGLNNRRMPLFLQLVVDGNGETEIVSIWFCKSESGEIADAMLDTFKELNPSWTKVTCIIGDKDFADRGVYRQKFPQAALQICLFHVLRAFNRDITTAKRQITKEQREIALDILQRLCYSHSEEAYDAAYQELLDLGLDEVTEYFTSNWHTIRDEWTMFGKNKYANYLNYTNNRTESLNGQLKTVCSRYANLLNFFDNLATCVAVISSEKDIKAVQGNMRVPRKKFGNEALQNYQKLLTSFTFSKLRDQFECYEKVNFATAYGTQAVTTHGFTVTMESCSCSFFRSMQLPCRHIFQFCDKNGMNMYQPQICATRWTKGYYNKSHPALQEMPVITSPAPLYVQNVRVPDEVQKYKAAAKMTKEINSLVSTLPPDHFAYIMGKLEHMKNQIIGVPEQSVVEARYNSELPGPSNDIPLEPTLPNRASEQGIPSLQTSTANLFQKSTVNNIVSTPGPSTVKFDNVTSLSSQSNSGSQFLLLTSTKGNVIRTTTLPPKNPSVGRPKEHKNVVGTKRKQTKQPNSTQGKVTSISFANHAVEVQALTVLNWLTNIPMSLLSSKKTKLTYSNIIQDEFIFQRLTHEDVDIDITKKYWNNRSYQYVVKEIKKQKAKATKCRLCKKFVRREAIFCLGCLDCYHAHCITSSKKPAKDYFCHDCV